MVLLCLQIIHQRGAFGVGGAFCLEEIGLHHVGVGILAHPAHGGGLGLVVLKEGPEPEAGPAQIAQITDVVGDHLPGQAGNGVADHVMAPGDFLPHALLQHRL